MGPLLFFPFSPLLSSSIVLHNRLLPLCLCFLPLFVLMGVTSAASTTSKCDSGEKYWYCSQWSGCCDYNPCIPGDRCIFLNMKTSFAEFITESEHQTKTGMITSTITRPTTTADEDLEWSTISIEESAQTDDETATETEMKESASKSMTDSGTTRTIPNPNKVTVTKHTLIITDRTPSFLPEVSTSTSSWVDEGTWPTSGSTGIGPPAQTNGSDPFAGDEGDSPLPTGTIVGAAVGGAAALAILAVLVFALLRRRRLNQDNSGMADGGDSNGEKNQWLGYGVSPHTTGTREDHDPFAPFGGRADRTDDPFRPPSNTYEMDGTSNVPVELPAVKFSDAREDPRPQFHPRAQPQARPQSRSQSQFHSTGSMSATPSSYGHPVQPAGPVDPRANLNASLRERQQHTYVNHWNQYRALGQDER
ncbi:uncharacterized protein NECHADRAFT_74638 [Fusarium vanettenii 77-13-4]|uniref:Uncharacterized protein n=1 Tax=Fusarium vanettenii (strain ATCC MYA-4622 / CBS 123669 / FGSC 9596 / NRRL 45880 / 77-13-4) TaxID=660122 RepID=C7YKK1_FUSV7|nr:uncharacterized protein NECHADRAFT_74638 [Fusarium vanettenii 77-13-4]EEU47752.1 hypothetical protein NECHADRAFT_74638 [Fusarium vanettenii 77-13-4]